MTGFHVQPLDCVVRTASSGDDGYQGQKRKEYQKSKTLLNEALHIARNSQGNSHPDVAIALEKVATLERDEGSLTKALNHYNEALRIRKAVMDPGHLSIASTLIGISQIHGLLKQYDMAALMSKQALAIILKIPNRETREASVMLETIGTMCFDIGKYDLAMDVYKEELQIHKASIKNELKIANTLTNMVRVHKIRDDYGMAIKCQQEALVIQKKILGNRHPSVYSSLVNIAQFYCKDKEFAKAIDMYEEAIQHRKQHDDDDLETSTLQDSIGLASLKIGNFSKAVRCFSYSLHIKKAVLGNNHKDIALVLYKIATAYLMKGNEEHSIFFYKQTLRTQKIVHGSDHMDTALTLKRIGNVYLQRGDLTEALNSFNEALQIERKHFGDAHISVARILNQIGNIHLQKAQVSEAKNAFTVASRILRQAGVRDDLEIEGFKFYELSLLHPEAAAVA